jgi:hypothetical protein
MNASFSSSTTKAAMSTTSYKKWLLPAATIGVVALGAQLLYKKFYAKKSGRVLLPTNVVPKRYTVELMPDFDAFTFDGSVVVEVDVVEATSAITVHSKEMVWSAATVTLASGVVVATTSVTFDEKVETATMHFASKIPVGAATVTVASFVGELNDRLNGFYRSSYTLKGSDEKKLMGVTQFEATHARQAFPCWDEPLLKAVFSIALLVPADRTALSNMPVTTDVAAVVNGRQLHKVTFDDTPIVSSYLLAWAIGEFDFVEATTKHGTVVRVYTLPGLSHQVGAIIRELRFCQSSTCLCHQTAHSFIRVCIYYLLPDQVDFALDCAVKILTSFTAYFAIKHSLFICLHIASIRVILRLIAQSRSWSFSPPTSQLVSRCPSSTCLPCLISLPALWRTGGSLHTARRLCYSTLKSRRRASKSASPPSWRTSSRTSKCALMFHFVLLLTTPRSDTAPVNERTCTHARTQRREYTHT